MMSFLNLLLVCLASIAQAQLDTGCGTMFPSSTTVSPTTISSCTLFYTPSMPPQIGPTSTVYATMMTTQFNVVNCNYCQISNVGENPVPTVSSPLISVPRSSSDLGPGSLHDQDHFRLPAHHANCLHPQCFFSHPSTRNARGNAGANSLVHPRC
jgi:hypothetical protein